jgi:hypothetical protein
MEGSHGRVDQKRHVRIFAFSCQAAGYLWISGVVADMRRTKALKEVLLPKLCLQVIGPKACDDRVPSLLMNDLSTR